MRFTLYPIYWLSDEVDDEQFELQRLPFDVTENVRIEGVTQRFRADAFDLGREKLGTGILEEVQGVRYALVHRYEPEPIISEHTHEILGYKQSSESSETLIRQMAACLRLIRPMRQSALLMRGEVRGDGTFDVTPRRAIIALRLGRPRGGDMSEGPDTWLEFQSKFRELADEEARVPQRETLGVHAELREHPEVMEQRKEGVISYSVLKAPRHGMWQYRCRYNPDLEARFRALAARAGIALDNPEGTNSEDFWLYRLFFDLLANDRRALFCGTKNGGMILSVCRSSASFCARLERDAIEQEQNEAQNSPRQPGPQSPVDPLENLHNAIITEKARIAEIERTLNRPPVTEYRGRPVHGGQYWRQRLEEDRQYLLAVVGELEAERKRTVSVAQNSDKTTEGGVGKPRNRKPERDDPEVAKRAALARSNPNTSAAEMCEIFDREGVPLPTKWQAAGFKTWSAASKDSNYRSRIDTLISKDRRKS